MNARWRWMAGCAAFTLGTGMACAAEWFVATNGSDAAAGTNWPTAKQTIQAGVDAATNGDTVWVSNGVYATGGAAVAGDWTNRVAITKPILVQSMNGPAETVITGGVVRCAYVTNGAVLSGFTLTGGRTAEGASALLYDQLLYGGGAWCEAEGVLTNCVVQGNRGHWGGGGVRGGRLDNCLLTENWTERGGGGTYESLANLCIYSNNWAHSPPASRTATEAEAPGARPREVELRRGGAAYGGVLNHCVLEQNESYGYGGATYYAALDWCTVKNNYASDGCAAYGGSLSNCTVTGNHGDGHAVLYDCTLANCLVANNHNDMSGTVKDCTLFNCTVTANSSYEDTGGANGSTLHNCIVYGNSAGVFSESNHLDSTFVHSCTAPDPGGTANITANPQFADAGAGNFRLGVYSPCINSGTNLESLAATDLDGNPRIIGGIVDMGAYESVHLLAITPVITNLPFEGASGNAIEVWAIAPWTAVTNAPWLSITAGCAGASNGTVVFNAASNNGTAWRTGAIVVAGGGFSHTCMVIQAVNPLYSDHWHVATNGSDAAAGTNWPTAKQTIQAAVDAAADGDTVWVSNGVYAAGGRVWQGRTINRIVLDKAVRVESMAGPLDTTVMGGDRTRCAYVGANAVLSGFTLMNGRTWDDCMAGETNFHDHFGGGAWCEPFGVITNCRLIENAACQGGGGVYKGLLDGCWLLDNHCSQFGGAAYGSVLLDSVVSNNLASLQGGGTYDCRLQDCMVVDNWAADGSAACFGFFTNCVITGNTGDGDAVLFGCTLVNCLVAGNHEESAGVLMDCTLRSCTIVGNESVGVCGGAYQSTLYNCIIHGNSGGGAGASNHLESTFHHSCTAPDPGGTGNIAGDPQFADVGGGDYRLSAISPCIDAGDNAAVLCETDLDGNPRVVYGAVDMGAYELQLAGSGTWFSAITNGLTNDLDCAAGDNVPNLLKYATGSSPRISDTLMLLDWELSGWATLKFNRNPNATDVILMVEGADGLAAGTVWRGVATNTGGSWGGATNVSESGTGNPVACTVTEPVALESNRFLRLRVTRP